MKPETTRANATTAILNMVISSEMSPIRIYVSPESGPVHGIKNHLKIFEYVVEQLQLLHLRDFEGFTVAVLVAVLFALST
jgi:hypothetical protein